MPDTQAQTAQNDQEQKPTPQATQGLPPVPKDTLAQYAIGERFLRSGGRPFMNKGALTKALKDTRLIHDYTVLPLQNNAGWVGLRRGLSERKFKIRLYHSNMDPLNKNLPVDVGANSPMNKSRIIPGQESTVSESQLNTLNVAVEDTQINIPADSGIYEARDPEALAQLQYEDMIPVRDKLTNLITMVKRTPNFIIQVLGEVKPDGTLIPFGPI